MPEAATIHVQDAVTDFRAYGLGQIAYVRYMRFSDVCERYRGPMPDGVDPDTALFVLVDAEGDAIMLGDTAEAIENHVSETDLEIMRTH